MPALVVALPTRRSSRIARRLSLLIVVVLLGVLIAVASRSSRPAVVEADQTDPTPYGFIDQGQGAYVVVQLSAGRQDYGMVNVAVPGIGLFLSKSPAQVNLVGNTAQLSYSGDGFLDVAAELDTEYVSGTRASDQATATPLQLTAQLDIAQHTGTAQLTANGQVYNLAVTAPPANADGVAAQVNTALLQQDWTTLCGLADRRLQNGISQGNFVTLFSTDFQSLGTLSGVRMLVSPTYSVERWGYNSARVLVELTSSSGGNAATRWLETHYIFDNGAWRFTGFIPVAVDQLLVAPGGPYTVAPGQSVTVAATPFNPSGGTLTFAWDLDGNGTFETPGQTATFVAAGNVAPGERMIAVKVTSSTGATATGQTTVAIPSGPQTTALTVAAANAPYGGATTLTATLNAGATPLPGKSVAFTLNSTAVGSATTDANGVATLTNVSIAGINASATLYSGAIGASNAGDASYVAASGTGDLTVTKATATIALSNLNQNYNGATKAATATTAPAGLAGVALTYSQNGTPVAAPTNVGSYVVTATLSNPNYSAPDASGTLAIAQAIPTLTWSTPASITDSTPRSSTQLNATASVPGAYVYSPAAGTTLPAGTQNLAVTFTPTDTTNYATATKSVSLTVTTSQPGTITPDGPGVPVTVSSGQTVTLTFSGVAKQRVSVSMAGWGGGACTANLRLLNPSGSQVAYGDNCYGGGAEGYIGSFILSAAGTYTVELDPSNATIGSATLRLNQDVAGPIAAGGAAVPVAIAYPGQRAALTFSGSSGQRVSVSMAGWGGGACTANLRLLNPSGSQVAYGDNCSGTGSTGIVSAVTLSAAGTYTVELDPSGATIGNATLTLTTVTGSMPFQQQDILSALNLQSVNDGGAQVCDASSLSTSSNAGIPVRVFAILTPVLAGKYTITAVGVRIANYSARYLPVARTVYRS